MKSFLIRFFCIALGLVCALPMRGASVKAELSGSDSPGGEATVTVSLNSLEGLSALQIVIPGLGEVAEVVDGSASGAGRASDFGATAGLRADGSATLMLYSTVMAEIPAGDGPVGSFRIRLGENPAHVSLPLTVIATDASGSAVSGFTSSPLELLIAAPRAEYPAGKAYDFGRVAIRDTYALRIPVRNTGTSPLTIDAVRFSHSALSVQSDALPITIQAGAEADLTVNFSPSERGVLNATATISGNSSSPDNVLRILGAPYAVNEIHVGNAEGISDSTVEIPILMNNMDPVSGFTLEFELPSHLEYEEGSFELSGRKADHTLVATSDGHRLHATAYSLSDTPFAGNDGAIASFRVKLAGSASAYVGPAKAVLPAVIDGEIANVLSDSYPGLVTISYPQIYTPGDIALGRTPITEAIEATLEINNWSNVPLTVEKITLDGLALDIDAALPLTVEPWATCPVALHSTSLTEGRIEGLLRIYSNDPDRRMVEVSLMGERYAPNELSLFATQPERSEGECTVTVELNNYDALSALQFDLTVPEGFTAGEIALCRRTEGFSVEARPLDARTLRVFCFSLSGGEIAPGTGAVLEIPFTFPETTPVGTYIFKADNFKLSDASMNDRNSALSPYSHEFYYSITTGVSAPTVLPEAASEEYFDLNGRRVNSPRKGTIILRRAAGGGYKVIRL